MILCPVIDTSPLLPYISYGGRGHDVFDPLHSRGHKGLTAGVFLFLVFWLVVVIQVQNKRHGIHFTSLSVVGIMDDNIYCHRWKPVNKRFLLAAIYTLDCTVCTFESPKRNKSKFTRTTVTWPPLILPRNSAWSGAPLAFKTANTWNCIPLPSLWFLFTR